MTKLETSFSKHRIQTIQSIEERVRNPLIFAYLRPAKFEKTEVILFPAPKKYQMSVNKLSFRNVADSYRFNRHLPNSMTYNEYYEYFKKDLDLLSDDALIARFNSQVGIRAFGVARQGHLSALRASLDERNIDYSAVGDDQTLRFDRKVRLVEKKIEVVE